MNDKVVGKIEYSPDVQASAPNEPEMQLTVSGKVH